MPSTVYSFRMETIHSIPSNSPALKLIWTGHGFLQDSGNASLLDRPNSDLLSSAIEECSLFDPNIIWESTWQQASGKTAIKPRELAKQLKQQHKPEDNYCHNIMTIGLAAKRSGLSIHMLSMFEMLSMPTVTENEADIIWSRITKELNLLKSKFTKNRTSASHCLWD